MTEPVGEVTADLRISGDKAAGDVRRDLEEVGAAGDAEMASVGKHWSATLDSEVKKGVKDTGRDVARSISSGIEHEGLKVSKVVSQFDAEGNLVRTWVTEIADKMEKEVASSGGGGGGGGGPFAKVGRAIRDAIGAGFNIPGGSPLTLAFIPVVGGVVELVAGAIQAVNGLLAVLAVVPNAIASIGLQLGILLLIFHGMPTAIAKAFSAQTPQDFAKAIEKLTPAAQDFVRSLMPLKDLFDQLKTAAQNNFFQQFAKSLQVMTSAIGPSFVWAAQSVGAALGGLLGDLVTTFGSDAFQQFLNQLIPATVQWIRELSPAITSFVAGLAQFGTMVMPFFNWLGQQLTGSLADFGTWLAQLSVNPDFLGWLDSMKGTLKDLVDVGASVLAFVKELIVQVDKAGGRGALADLAKQIDMLTKALATEQGQKALEGIIHTAELLTYVLVESVITIGALIFAFQWLIDHVPGFLYFIGEKTVGLFNTLTGLFMEFFTVKVPAWWDKVVTYFSEAMDNILKRAGAVFSAIVDFIGSLIGEIIKGLFAAVGAVVVWVADRINDIGKFFSDLGSNIWNWIGGLADTLWQAGANLVQRLIDGMLSKLGPLGDALNWIAQQIKDHNPSSPPKKGPLSGKGDPLIAGQEISKRLAAGILMGAPAINAASATAVSNVNMGAGTVQMNFYGQLPTQQQAAGIGAAAGNSMVNTIAQRNAQLTIRSIGSAAIAA